MPQGKPVGRHTRATVQMFTVSQACVEFVADHTRDHLLRTANDPFHWLYKLHGRKFVAQRRKLNDARLLTAQNDYDRVGINEDRNVAEGRFPCYLAFELWRSDAKARGRTK